MKKQQVTIEVPEGCTAVFTRVGDFANVTFEPIEQPKEEPKLPMSLGELVKIDGYSTHNLVWPTEKESNAARAFSQLLQLRNAWGGCHDKDTDEDYWSVSEPMSYNSLVFCFPTEELRDRFQTQFADLIKTASPLL